MKHRFIILSVIALALVSTVMAQSGDSSPEEIVRSLKTMVVSSPDSVLAQLDEIEAEGRQSLPPYQVSLLRGLAYNEKRMFSLVGKYAREVLDCDSIDSHQAEKVNALTLLAVSRSFFGDFQGSIQYSLDAIDIAREAGNLAAEFNILTTMAKTAFAMGQRSRGYEWIDDVIDRGGDSDEVRVLANVSAAYGVKIVELYADDRFEEGLAESNKRLALIDRIEELGGSPVGYPDQQRAYAYARIASCAQRAGHQAEAAEAYDKFMATDYAVSPVGHAYIMDYLLDAGKWTEVQAVCRPLFPLFEQSDTINDDFHSLLISAGRAEAALGDYSKAYLMMQRAAVVKDSLYMREKNSRAYELATVFDLKEKELALAQSESRLWQRHILMCALGGVVILVLIILALVWHAYRVSKREQRNAAHRIDELLEMNRRTEISKSFTDDFEKFRSMNDTIINGKLFRNPSFTREDIAGVTGMPRAKVMQLITQFMDMTPGEYINKLRVEYAAQLIHEHPDWVIDAVAAECGYVRRATLYQHFTKAYGLTPAQYRRLHS